MDTVLESRSSTFVIGDGKPFCIIGERINPTGRKGFQAQLQAGDLSQLAIDVAEQVEGAPTCWTSTSAIRSRTRSP